MILLIGLATSAKFTCKVRFEAINALNHPNFAQPTANATDPNFGKVTSNQNYTRRLQLTLKFVF